MRQTMAQSVSLCLLLVVGCSGESFPRTYPVSGVVTYDGKPVEKATVNLVPTTADGRSASGETDGDGKFTVTTYLSPTHSPAGALPGDYLVTVVKMEVPQMPEGLTQWEVQAWSQKAGAPKPLLPKIYLDPAKSGLKATVQAGTNAPLTFDLKD